MTDNNIRTGPTPRGTAPLIFVHIFKTAGCTIRNILRHNYWPKFIFTIDPNNRSVDDLLALTQEERDQIKVLQGHFPYGLHRYFSKPPKYFTMLREPIDRITSLYYYQKERERSFANLSFEDFCRYQCHNNLQTRFVAGKADSSMPKDKLLELAKLNLLNNYACFGLTEEFDLSLLLLKKRVGLKTVFYKKTNTTKKRIKTADIPDRIRKIICDNNQHDLELYRYAKELFYGQPDCRDILRNNELRWYRFNNLYRPQLDKLTRQFYRHLNTKLIKPAALLISARIFHRET